MYRFSLQRCGRRSFSISSFPFTNKTPSDSVSFPSVARGLDYDLNWSLAAELVFHIISFFLLSKVSVSNPILFHFFLPNPSHRSSLTTRGEAYRNATIRDLLEFAGSRGTVEVTKERALVVRTPTPTEAGAFATDAFVGRTVMDVEEFEGRLASVCTSISCVVLFYLVT
jgi:hypothetical protein